MNLALLFYFFSGLTLHTNLPYVTSFLRLCGMLFLVMNSIVLVGLCMRPPTSFASGQSSFAEDVLQFVFGFSHELSII